MRTATIAEAKEKLEELIAAGEPVEITLAGEPVASLVPESPQTQTLPRGEVNWEARMADLEARGLVTRPKGSPQARAKAIERLLQPLPGDGPSGVLDALLEERRTGR